MAVGKDTQNQPKLSSFFKPSQGPSSQANATASTSQHPPKRRAGSSSSSDVIVIDSSDDESPAPARPAKQPKLERPDSDSADLLRAPVPTPAPTASSSRLSHYAFDEFTAPRETTAADRARRDAFRSTLLANPVQRRSAYLQPENHLAAREDGDDEMQVDLDDDQGDEEPPAKAKAPESRFAKFANAAAKPPPGTATEKGMGKGKGKEKAAPAIKYTPLEKQVLALKEQNPGVVLLFEVGYKYRFFQEE